MLDSKKQPRNGAEGCLPAQAPLANPYVPFQLNNPPQYEDKTAIIRGTLFPGLDLPFMGMINKKELANNPLAELQTISFIIQELALYLDTHRNDEEANEMYGKYQKIYNEGVKKYERIYGPLNHFTESNGAYSWVRDPWPWEYAANREG